MEHSTYKVTSLEQMKVLSNKLRVQILNLFGDYEPRTSKQMADMLGMAASKVHYHVRELERVGLMKLVDQRAKGGVIEKYYLPVAMYIQIDWKEGGIENREPKLVRQMTNAMAEEFMDAYQKAYGVQKRREDAGEDLKEEESILLKMGFLFLTEEERAQMRQEMSELYAKWGRKGKDPHREGTEEWRAFWALFPDR